MKNFILIPIWIMLTVQPIIAQSSDGNDRQKTVFEIRSEGGNKYLKVLHELTNFESDDRMQQAMKDAVISPISSFMAPNATYDSLLKTVRPRFTADSIESKIKAHGQFGKKALIQTLKNEITETNLVLINEHHYYPTHRMLVEELLPVFADAGYTYLALEALTVGQDSLLNAGHPPTIETGFYTKDPRFANLIRTAQSLDYQFIAYENTDRNLDREEGQAANLVQASFAKDPNAKVLVLAGMDHILEKPTQRGKKWFGYILNESYGLDPLTINQFHLMWFKDRFPELTLVDSETFSDHLLRSVDYHLINNLPLTADDPNYSFDNIYGEQVQLSFYLKDEVESKQDYDRLIPAVSALAQENESLELFLPNEELQLMIYDQDGEVLHSESLNHIK